MQQLLACYDSDDETKKDQQHTCATNTNARNYPPKRTSDSLSDRIGEKKLRTDYFNTAAPPKSLLTGDELPVLPDDLFGGING